MMGVKMTQLSVAKMARLRALKVAVKTAQLKVVRMDELRALKMVEEMVARKAG